jgi:hypothetical protein
MVLKRGENVGDRYVKNTNEQEILEIMCRVRANPPSPPMARWPVRLESGAQWWVWTRLGRTHKLAANQLVNRATRTSAGGNPSGCLELRKISKNFGAITALTDVDLAIQPGEVLGLMGDNARASRRWSRSSPAISRPVRASIMSTTSRPGFSKPVEARQKGHRGRLPGPRAVRQSHRRLQRFSRARGGPPGWSAEIPELSGDV